MSKSKVFFLFITLSPMVFFSSCDDERERKYVVCDCKGTGLEEFENEEGVVALTTSGYRIISGRRGYVKDCEELPEDFRKHGVLVKISGHNVKSCNTIDPSYDRYINNADLKTIMPIEDIKVIGRVKVEVFYSTNEGGVSGWGYFLQDTVRNFNIRQAEIPAQAGWEQFKTPEEAWVVAVLIAYKINYSTDFPDFTPDSAFLGY